MNKHTKRASERASGYVPSAPPCSILVAFLPPEGSFEAYSSLLTTSQPAGGQPGCITTYQMQPLALCRPQLFGTAVTPYPTSRASRATDACCLDSTFTSRRAGPSGGTANFTEQHAASHGEETSSTSQGAMGVTPYTFIPAMKPPRGASWLTLSFSFPISSLPRGRDAGRSGASKHPELQHPSPLQLPGVNEACQPASAAPAPPGQSPTTYPDVPDPLGGGRRGFELRSRLSHEHNYTV